MNSKSRSIAECIGEMGPEGSTLSGASRDMCSVMGDDLFTGVFAIVVYVYVYMGGYECLNHVLFNDLGTISYESSRGYGNHVSSLLDRGHTN